MLYTPVHYIFTLRYLYAHFTEEKIEAQKNEVIWLRSHSKWDWKSALTGFLQTHWGVGMGRGDTGSLSWLPTLLVTSHLPCHLALGLFTQVTAGEMRVVVVVVVMAVDKGAAEVVGPW